jgi:CRP-like cAMP-binding protein
MATDVDLAPDTLERSELFQGLPRAALAQVTQTARLRRLKKKTVVFSQGDSGVRAHLVISGCVRISQSGSDGGQVIIRFIGPHETFGTISLFTDGRYPADAVTVEETVEASWSEAELLALMAEQPQIAINVVRFIGRRLQEVQDRVRELSTQTAERRVAHAVLRLARQAGHGTTGGTAIAFPLRRKDVAHISGTSLYTASRILTGWSKAGLLASRSQRLTLRKPMDIQRIAESSSD